VHRRTVDCESNTLEDPNAITSRKRPPLLSDEFSNIPKVCQSNHYKKYVEPLVSDRDHF